MYVEKRSKEGRTEERKKESVRLPEYILGISTNIHFRNGCVCDVLIYSERERVIEHEK